MLLFPSVFAWEQSGAIHGSDAYDKLAQNLLQTGVYGFTPGIPDAAIPPLYSYVVAGVYALFGRASFPLAIVHILFDLMCIGMLYTVTGRLFPPTPDSKIPYVRYLPALSGLFYAVYPYLIFQNLTLIDTPLFMVFLYGFILALVSLREKFGWSAVIFGGICLGLGVLSRPIIAPLGIFGAVWFMFRLPLIETVKRLAPVAGIGVLLVLPWQVHTYQLHKAVIPIANNGGMNFWFGNSRYTIPFLWSGYHPQWATPDSVIDRDSRIANNQYMAESTEFLRTHPEKIPELLWVKFLAHWSIDVYPSRNPVIGSTPVIDNQGRLVFEVAGLPVNDPVAAYAQPLFDRFGRVIHILYFGGLLSLALIGLWLTRRDWRTVALVWFVQVNMTLVYVLIIPATRYRVPSDPLLFIFSGVALLWIAGWFRKRISRLPPVPYSPATSQSS